MEKNIFFVISGPKSNYPENLDLIDKKNGHTDRHPIALYNGIQCAFFMRTKVNANFTYLYFIEIDHLYLIFFIMFAHFINF